MRNQCFTPVFFLVRGISSFSWWPERVSSTFSKQQYYPAEPQRCSFQNATGGLTTNSVWMSAAGTRCQRTAEQCANIHGMAICLEARAHFVWFAQYFMSIQYLSTENEEHNEFGNGDWESYTLSRPDGAKCFTRMFFFFRFSTWLIHIK